MKIKTLHEKDSHLTSKRKLFGDYSALIATLFLFGLLPSLKWMKLFPLVEYRSKIFFDFSFPWLLKGWTLTGENMYSTAFYFDTWIGRTCNTNIHCLNVAPQIIHLITSIALFVLAIKHYGSRIIASIVLAMWLTSVPYLETLSWQALNLDKIAALTTTLGALAGTYFFRQQYSVRNVILSNTVIFLLVVIGYNAKPSGWVLIPGLWMLPIIGNGLQLKSWYKYLIVPTMYGILNNIVWYRAVQADDFYRSHTSGGNPRINISQFIGYLHGSTHPTMSSKIVFVFVVCFLTLRSVLKLGSCRFGFWCVLMTLGGIVISARTVYGSAFYMLVSQVFYCLALGAVIREFLILAKRFVVMGHLTAIFTLFACVLFFVPGLRSSHREYGSVLVQSENFMESFERIKLEVARCNQEKLKILIDDSMDYKYVDGGPIGKFISTNFPILESNISYMNTNEFQYDIAESDTLYVVYDEKMNISDVFVLPNRSELPGS